MSLYNMLFGVNYKSAVILAVLGLTPSDVGRFRDSFITPEGQIAIYTRNGGGNRDCWHDRDEWYADERCRNESRVADVDEIVYLSIAAAAEHPEYKAINVWVGSERGYKTGQLVAKTQYRCLEPNSELCACTGCIATYRLPNHPLYIRDEDDDFDRTYATFYFRAPEEYAADILAAASGETWNPSERWTSMLATLGAAKRA